MFERRENQMRRIVLRRGGIIDAATFAEIVADAVNGDKLAMKLLKGTTAADMEDAFVAAAEIIREHRARDAQKTLIADATKPFLDALMERLAPVAGSSVKGRADV